MWFEGSWVYRSRFSGVCLMVDGATDQAVGHPDARESAPGLGRSDQLPLGQGIGRQGGREQEGRQCLQGYAKVGRCMRYTLTASGFKYHEEVAK